MCNGYVANVFVGESSNRSRFETWLQEIEVDNKCSGICSAAYNDLTVSDQNTALFYLFSNVNNGRPKQSCKMPIRENVLS